MLLISMSINNVKSLKYICYSLKPNTSQVVECHKRLWVEACIRINSVFACFRTSWQTWRVSVQFATNTVVARYARLWIQVIPQLTSFLKFLSADVKFIICHSHPFMLSSHPIRAKLWVALITCIFFLAMCVTSFLNKGRLWNTHTQVLRNESTE